MKNCPVSKAQIVVAMAGGKFRPVECPAQNGVGYIPFDPEKYRFQYTWEFPYLVDQIRVVANITHDGDVDYEIIDCDDTDTIWHWEPRSDIVT